MLMIRVDPLNPDASTIARAAELLRKRQLVAFPTETVYGLGAHALDEAAVQAIFAAKGRPSYNPLIVHVADVDAARCLTRVWPESADRLAQAFWPGPLTLVLPKHPGVPSLVTAGLDSVAVRIPAHPVAQALLHAADLPIAAPSANRSGEISPTTAQHVEKSLGDAVALILDGGPTPLGIESTVVDLSSIQPALLRPGVLSTEELEPVLGTSLLLPQAFSGTSARPSPGMLDRHYAPRAPMHAYESHEKLTAVERTNEAAQTKQVVGALLLSPLEAPLNHPIAMPAEPRAYARLLFAALHSLEDLNCDLILVEYPLDSPAWAGVRDRLRRASNK